MNREKYIQIEKDLAVTVAASKITAVRTKSIQKNSLRLYKDDTLAVGGTLGVWNEKDLEKQAIKASENQIPYPYKPTENKQHKLIEEDNLPPEENFLSISEEIIDFLRQDYPDLIFSNKLKRIELEDHLSNDMGTELHHKRQAYEIGLLFKEKSSSNIIDGALVDFTKAFNMDDFKLQTKAILDPYQNKIDLPKEKKIPVIFDLNMDIAPLHMFIRDLHGLSYGTGGSFLGSKKEKNLFHKDFTLFQTSNPETVLEPFFDAEGTYSENFKVPLIENGKIISPYTDKKTAAMFDLPLTGSAKAEYDGVPDLRFKFFAIQESEKNLREMLDGRPAIFSFISMGGDFTQTGEFSTPVQVPLLFDGNKFVGRLPEVTVSSNVFDMFGKDFLGVSKNPLSTRSTSRWLVTELLIK